MSALCAREARSEAWAAGVGRRHGFGRSALRRQVRSKAERAYRRWCLERRLFVNPLNDLGAHPLAAFDDFVLPPLSERFGDRESAVTPPAVIGFFNQMKQEYASARFMQIGRAHV